MESMVADCLRCWVKNRRMLSDILDVPENILGLHLLFKPDQVFVDLVRPRRLIDFHKR